MVVTKTIKQWAKDLQEHINRGQPYGLTFYHNSGSLTGEPKKITEPITTTQKVELEQYLKAHFDLWAKSWLQPVVDEMNNYVPEVHDSRLKEMADTLLQVTYHCRPDMHEPDEQSVSAIVTGFRLDNAMGANPVNNCGEFTVGIKNEIHNSDNPEWFNLADLIALARIGANAITGERKI